MTDRPKPLVSIAAVCERVLSEKDDVLTLIRVVDTFTVTLPPGAPPDAQGIVQFYVVIVLKSGDARGKYDVVLRTWSPSGKSTDLGEPTSVLMSGGEQGTSVVVHVSLPVTQQSEQGVYWIDVVADSELLTRIPFRLRAERDEDERSEHRSPLSESEVGSSRRDPQ